MTQPTRSLLATSPELRKSFVTAPRLSLTFLKRSKTGSGGIEDGASVDIPAVAKKWKAVHILAITAITALT